jgi:uncharacterized protein YuzE
MRIDASGKAITFIRTDEPVARTISNEDGLLLDLNERGEIIAMELHEQGSHDLSDLIEYRDDIDAFMQELRATVDEMMRDLKPRKRNRRTLEMAHDFAHHAPA